MQILLPVLPVAYPNDPRPVVDEDLAGSWRDRYAQRFCWFIVTGREGSGAGPI